MISNGFVRTIKGSWINLNCITRFIIYENQDYLTKKITFNVEALSEQLQDSIIGKFEKEVEAQTYLDNLMELGQGVLGDG